MKIAVVTPKSCNGEKGGAENLYERLIRALIEFGHDATQVEVLIDESSFEGILEAYCRCFYLDLNDYDAVISTKAPTYMVKHPNHISYLLDTIRLFYDMSDREFKLNDKKRLKQRHLIHEFDKYGLSSDRIKRHFAIGTAVYERMRALDDYWNQIEFEVIHLPSKLEKFKVPSSGDLIFLPGSLHRDNRPDLIIKAMKYVNHNINLIISGHGEDETTYRQLSQGDNRIKFVGWIDDDEIIDYYSRSIVIPFVPINKDSGLIIVEAFKSKKPVITCSDSGVPFNFIKDGVNGFIVEPDPQEIAKKINYLIENPEESKQMGENGALEVQDVTWENAINKFLGAANPKENNYKNKEVRKVLVTDIQILDPPIGGGRVRIYELYKNFDPLQFNIVYLGTFDWLGPSEREQYLAGHFQEILVPMTVPHIMLDKIYSKLCKDNTTLDVTAPKLMKYTPKYKRKLFKIIKDKDIVIVSHPWVYPYVKEAMKEMPIKPILIYDSQNFEYKIKREILKDTLIGIYLSKIVKDVERSLVNECNLIFSCSHEDSNNFIKNYDINKDKILIIPNGASIDDISFPTTIEKDLMKRRFGFGQKTIIIFLASGGYRPNDDAAEYICSILAHQLPEVIFILVGGICDILSKRHNNEIPNNVILMGIVNDDDKKASLYSADIALNPVSMGSGTNIKLFDFLAAGLPIVSTPIGARGIDFVNNENLVVAELDDFLNNIKMIIEDDELKRKLSKGARCLAERYAWKNIARIAQDGIFDLENSQ